MIIIITCCRCSELCIFCCEINQRYPEMMMKLCRISQIFKIKRVCHPVAHMAIAPVAGHGASQTTTRAVESPLPQIKPPGLEPDPSGPSRASPSHCIPAGALLPRESLNGLREIDSVAVHPIKTSSLPSPIPAALPVLTRETKPAERTMNGKAPRRPRESKKEAVCLCSRGGMRKCPRSVSNLSEGGQATFSRRGKARQRRSSHRRAGLQLHGPIRGYMEEGKKRRRKKERRKSKEERGFWRAVSRVCLCPMTPPPPPPILQPLPLHTPHPQSCSESV